MNCYELLKVQGPCRLVNDVFELIETKILIEPLIILAVPDTERICNCQQWKCCHVIRQMIDATTSKYVMR